MSPALTIWRGDWSKGCSRLLRLRIVTAVVFFCGLSVASQSASASCGDYLLRHGKSVSNYAVPMNPVTDSGDLKSESHPLELPIRHCSGPDCSNGPLPLAPVPATPSSLPRGIDPAAILEKFFQSCTTRGAFEIPESERGACCEPSSIFRPPTA